ncbi:MAG: PilN domain-containing protein [Gammaproteobacteria bacterium]|nr:PilN domain-containing protein [Gammaproteobacteria bacterium]
MISFDLVPGDYRARLVLKESLKRLSGLLVGLTVIALVSSAALAFVNKSLHSQIQLLQNQHAVTTQQRNDLESLDAQIQELVRQWQLLTTLRSGAPAEHIFTVIDSALEDNSIWFQRWAFVREGKREKSQGNTVNTGYFIVVSDDVEAKPSPAWDIETHIKISGQARDHAALSRFVRGLFNSPQVSDVKVQNSTLQRFAAANVVRFDLAVILNGESKK